MALTTDTKLRLLGAIENDSLVFLCGAGLSMPSPSDLPSALRVAQRCYDKWIPNEPDLDPGLRTDIDALAGHFYAKSNFESVFLPLVPWNELVGSPNSGHAAVADFLISKAARGALSANFDPLIEMWAEMHKISMLGALTGQEAQNAAVSPLVKFHGCLRLSRSSTLWTRQQLSDPAIQARVASCSQWMNLTLPGKHLLVVGFWTDWGYLNDVLENAFAIQNASSVTVIDPATTANLQAKAPLLWAKLNGLSQVFEHVEAKSEEALEELRTEFGKAWARKLFSSGTPLAENDGISAIDVGLLTAPDGLSSNALYDLRRDSEGTSYARAATQKVPPADAAQLAYFHILMLKAGATRDDAWLNLNGTSIRIVNGAGQGLSQLKAEYKEPSTAIQADVVVCAGSVDWGAPGRIVASGRGASLVRPAPGGGSQWLTSEEAKVRLGL